VLRGSSAQSFCGNRPQPNAGQQQRDCSAQEIFSIFVGGGSLVIVPPGSEKDTQHMARMCKKHDVAACILVPSLLEALLRVRPMRPRLVSVVSSCRPHYLSNCGRRNMQEPEFRECASVRLVVCGGEALHLPLVKLFRTTLPHARLYNDYGPTEVTVGSTGVATLASLVPGTQLPAPRP
jgi:non-ribosomal peptide synthetase component F